MKAHMTIDRARIWVAVVILAVVALASFWALQTIRHQGEEDYQRTSPRSDPDYYVENFNFIKISNNGKANYHVTGDRLSHLPRSDEYEILHPVIHSFDDAKTPVTIRSERAIVEQKSETTSPKREYDLVHLYDQVSVERLDKASNDTMRLETDYLQLWPDTDIAKTDRPVTVTTKSSEAHAIGMIANNATQEVELLSKVHIRVQNRNRPQKSTDKNS
jgi:lipopolysaccharide export system protein LptC